MNPTSTHEDLGLIPDPAQWVKDLALLWLWCRPACSSDSTASLGTSVYCRCGPERKKGRKKILTSEKPRSGARGQCEKLHSKMITKGSRDSHFWEIGGGLGEGRKGRTRKNILGMEKCLGEEQSR